VTPKWRFEADRAAVCQSVATEEDAALAERQERKLLLFKSKIVDQSSRLPHYGLRYGFVLATGNFQLLRGRPPLLSALELGLSRSFTAQTRVQIPPGTPIKTWGTPRSVPPPHWSWWLHQVWLNFFGSLVGWAAASYFVFFRIPQFHQLNGCWKVELGLTDVFLLQEL